MYDKKLKKKMLETFIIFNEWIRRINNKSKNNFLLNQNEIDFIDL